MDSVPPLVVFKKWLFDLNSVTETGVRQVQMSFLERGSKTQIKVGFFFKFVIIIWVSQWGARTSKRKKNYMGETHRQHRVAAGHRRMPAGRQGYGGGRASLWRCRLDWHARVDWDHCCLLKSGAKVCFFFPHSAPSLFAGSWWTVAREPQCRREAVSRSSELRLSHWFPLFDLWHLIITSRQRQWLALPTVTSSSSNLHFHLRLLASACKPSCRAVRGTSSCRLNSLAARVLLARGSSFALGPLATHKAPSIFPLSRGKSTKPLLSHAHNYLFNMFGVKQ